MIRPKKNPEIMPSGSRNTRKTRRRSGTSAGRRRASACQHRLLSPVPAPYFNTAIHTCRALSVRAGCSTSEANKSPPTTLQTALSTCSLLNNASASSLFCGSRNLSGFFLPAAVSSSKSSVSCQLCVHGYPRSIIVNYSRCS